MNLLPEVYFSPYDIAQIKRFFFFLGSLLSVFMLVRICHESTHGVMAWLLGGEDIDVKFGWLTGSVEYTMPEGTPIVYDRLINISPQLLGVFVGVPMLGWLYLNGVSILGIYIASAAVFMYTFLGGAADYSMAIAQGPGQWWTPDADETVAFISLVLVSLGMLFAAVNPTGNGIVVDYVEHFDMALTFAGIMLIGIWMIQKDRQSIA